MRDAYLRYYDRFSPLASLHFACDALRTPSRARRAALLNRQRDYIRLARHPQRLALHARLNRILLDATHQWTDFDYGEGYFYQGLDAIGVTGLRNTGARVTEMQLHRRLAGRNVLEIGCNCGFLALSIAGSAQQVRAFDVNPYLVEIARTAARAVGTDNVSFETTAFESFFSTRRFDAVLSFANHDTFDGNTRQSLRDYLQRCHRLLEPGGLFLFESHAPGYEKDRLTGALDLMSELFDITERQVLTTGSYLDKGRTFVVAYGKPDSALHGNRHRTNRPAEMLSS